MSTQQIIESWESGVEPYNATTNEHYAHDVCPKCKTKSVPFEGVPDQALRGCPKCHHDWFEDLDQFPTS